jgi:hypothetical protein
MSPLCRPLLLLLLAVGASQIENERGLREAIWAGHWIEGVRRYEEIEETGLRPSAQASYLAGWAEWMLRRPEEARPLVEKAVEAGFQAGGGRIQPRDLLTRIAQYTAAKPPAALVPGLDRGRIDPYADRVTGLTAPILDALPKFVEIGRQIFGEPPPVRFFLFAEKPALRRFYEAFQPSIPAGDEPHSTGGVNMVIFCEEKGHRTTGSETISIALHETTHAWVASYLRSRYDRVIYLPRYLDEGLAVYVASLWSEDVHRLTFERINTFRARHRDSPPRLEDLGPPQKFYEPDKAYLNYLLSDLLLERMLGPPVGGASKIPALLDALARSGDDAKAWHEVVGKDVAKEYDALVSELGR